MAVWIGAKAVVESIFGQMLAGKLLVKLSKRSLGLMPRKPTDQQKKVVHTIKNIQKRFSHITPHFEIMSGGLMKRYSFPPYGR